MKPTKHITAVILSSILLIIASASIAGSDYIVIQDSQELHVGNKDSSYINPAIISFNLPDNIYHGNDPARMAVLELAVRNASKKFNEIYINPPVQSCFADGTGTDINEPASVHYIDEHDGTGKPNEYFMNMKTFSSELLHPGQNVLMICSRDSVGQLSTTIENLLIRRVFLHYQID